MIHAYPSDSNRLGGISQDGAVVRSFLYDAAGNLTSDARLGTTTAYTISDVGRIGR